MSTTTWQPEGAVRIEAERNIWACGRCCAESPGDLTMVQATEWIERHVEHECENRSA